MKRQNIKTALLILLVFLSVSLMLFSAAFATPWIGFVNAVKVLQWANCPMPGEMPSILDCGNYILNRFYYLTYNVVALIITPAYFLYAFWDVVLVWVVLILIVLSLYEKYKNVN